VQPWTPCLLPAEGPVQEVPEADTSLREAQADGGQVRVYVGLVRGDHALLLVEVQDLVILLVPAAGLGPGAIPDRRRGGGRERLVGPRFATRARPVGALAIRHAGAKLGGDMADVSPGPALSDTRVPHGIELFAARPLVKGRITPAVVFERRVERLVHIAHRWARHFSAANRSISGAFAGERPARSAGKSLVSPVPMNGDDLRSDYSC
jgi:hypothetical protein